MKGIQVRKQGWGEEMHHISHTWVDSYREAGFSRWCMGWGAGDSQHKNWANSCRGLGLRVHPLNLGQFSKTYAFLLDTGFHNFGIKVQVNP